MARRPAATLNAFTLTTQVSRDVEAHLSDLSRRSGLTRSKLLREIVQGFIDRAPTGVTAHRLEHWPLRE